jgi:hypothetical protein
MNTIRVATTSSNTCAINVNDKHVASYWVPSTGGYVRKVTDKRPGNLGDQVSDNLAGSGDMMYLAEGQNLTEAIRKAARTRAGRENVLRQAGL